MDYAACFSQVGGCRELQDLEGLRNWREGMIDRRNDRLTEGEIGGVIEGKDGGGGAEGIGEGVEG
jgi:hypothetical protein